MDIQCGYPVLKVQFATYGHHVFKKLSYVNQKNGKTELLVICQGCLCSCVSEILTEISMLTARPDLFLFFSK